MLPVVGAPATASSKKQVTRVLGRKMNPITARGMTPPVIIEDTAPVVQIQKRRKIILGMNIVPSIIRNVGKAENSNIKFRSGQDSVTYRCRRKLQPIPSSGEAPPSVSQLDPMP